MKRSMYLILTASVLGVLFVQSKGATSRPKPHEYTSQQLYNETLKLHNFYRAKHGSGPLYLNKTLCLKASEWAKILAKNNTFDHSPDARKGKYGENLYAKWSSNPMLKVTAKDAFFSWYNEGKNYDYSKAQFSSKTGHFTQVVWKDTKSIGVAMVKNKSGKFVVVANYYPAGNVQGQYKKNVLKLK